MDVLKSFVQNEVVKKAVYDYFIATLHEEIIDKALTGKEVTGYQEAKNIIDRTFNNLEGEYGNKKNRTTQDPR
jgi:hypothetical protein